MSVVSPISTGSDILGRSAQIEYSASPFPHIVMRDCLEPAAYAELADAYPDYLAMHPKLASHNNTRVQLTAPRFLALPQMPACWRDFVSQHTAAPFFASVMRVLGDALLARRPDFAAVAGDDPASLRVAVRNTPEAQHADILLDCQPGINTPVRKPGSVRGMHVDRDNKLVAALMYFRDPRDNSRGGDLELFRLKPGRRAEFDRYEVSNPGALEKVRTVRYDQNVLVMFVNSRTSFHAVSRRSRTDYPRRLVNFVIESTRLTP